MTTQHPDQAVWPSSTEDIPAIAPGRAPAVAPVHPDVSHPPIRGEEDTSAGSRGDGQAVRDAAASRRRRAPRRLAIIAVAALLVGVSIGFGSNQWAVPRLRPASPAAAPTSPVGALIAQRQAAVNRAHLPTPELADFASPWLGRMGDCTADTITDTQRGNGETTRTRCTAGIVTTYWITYRTLTDRDAAQSRYRAQAPNASSLAPGATTPTDRATSTGREVSYVEYAYKIPSGERAGQVVAAIWWSDPTTPAAGVFTCYWDEGLASSWAPLRDLWAQTTTMPAQR